jgi:SET domain-containing protein 6
MRASLANFLKALTTLLILEAQKPDSKWQPYFDVLPSELNSLVFWSPAELAELQASAVVNKIGKDSAEQIFNTEIQPIVREASDIDTFHKFASTIMAYAFDIPENKDDDDENENEDDLVDDEEEQTTLAMIPLADMLNADADNNARLHYDGEELEMRAIRPIKADEEILNDYGQLPRSDLLRRYGYVTEKYAIFDVVELPTTTITEYIRKQLPKDHKIRLSSMDLGARLELAKREDVYEESYDIGHANEEYPAIPDELVAFLFILLVDKETFSALESSQKQLSSRSKMETQLVGEVLAAILKIRETDYPTSAEEDEQLLDGLETSSRRYMAIKVRQGEKQVLREAVTEASNFEGSNKYMLGQGSAKRGAQDISHDTTKKQKRR